jgi:hypothetical protein
MRFKDHYNRNIQSLITLFEYTVKDFSKVVPSKRNREWLKKRQDEGITGSTLTDVTWNDDKILLKYKSKATPTEPILNISKKGNQSGGSIYTVEIQFENVISYLGTKEDYLNQTKGEQRTRVRSMVREATVRVHSNDASFLWQGSWMRAKENDYNIYPIPSKRNKDKGIWKARHNKNEYITKHILEVVRTIPFVADKIAKTIREKYK